MVTAILALLMTRAFGGGSVSPAWAGGGLVTRARASAREEPASLECPCEEDYDYEQEYECQSATQPTSKPSDI